MTETIREQIVEAVVAKLWEATTSRGYQLDAGNNVRLADPRLSPDDCPAIVVWPGDEQVNQEHRLNVCDMQITVEALAQIGGSNPAIVVEQLLGDIIEAMTATQWTGPFKTGGTYEPQVGDTLKGNTSGETAYVAAITVSSGSWAGGNAAGTFTVRRSTGQFNNSETLAIGAHPLVASVNGAPTAEHSVQSTTDGLADTIRYIQGGPKSYPEARELVTGVSATFAIRYKTPIGNPYATA